MYYLEKKQLQPQLILLSVFFLPIILAMVVTFCINQSKTALIVLSILLSVYVVLIAVLGILSLRNNKYLEVKGDMLYGLIRSKSKICVILPLINIKERLSISKHCSGIC